MSNKRKTTQNQSWFMQLLHELGVQIILTLIIVALPGSMAAWVIIAWGSIWLIVPLVIIAGTILLWAAQR